MNSVRAVCLILAIGLGGSVAQGERPSFNHSLLQRLFDLHLHDRIPDYQGIQTDPALLDRYLEEVANLPPNHFEAFSREEKIAFLINVFNALTIKRIVEVYPVGNLGGILSKDDQTFTVMGRAMTRRDIEENLVRRRFRDERVHAALYRGSKSSPLLRPEVYSQDNLDRFLDEDARRFVNGLEWNRIEPGKRKIYLSALFKWYAQDFVLNYGAPEKPGKFKVAESAVLSFIADYLDPAKKPFLESGRFKIRYLPFDWTLPEGPLKK